MTSREKRIRFLQREVLRFETMERVVRERKADVLKELWELCGKRLRRSKWEDELAGAKRVRRIPSREEA